MKKASGLSSLCNLSIQKSLQPSHSAWLLHLHASLQLSSLWQPVCELFLCPSFQSLSLHLETEHY
ncbi:hypothetical protein SLEP1_g25541 [Rubroshorea leprosula]|uniref:Uncharacterized protein n=1 Tax=Rubroshorea leprosula TaxID=152421 RepID=A0AAV5JWQ2_9ROSI|nr:hypothetical protein SLEP1_g25541 [Rubroshorea leprosula]